MYCAVFIRCTTAVTLCHSLPFLAVTPCHLLYHSLSLVVIRCRSFSFIVTRCITRCHSLYQPSSLVVICYHSLYHSLSLVVIRCHSLYHSLSLVVIRCHSLSHSVPLVCLFINDPFFSTKFDIGCAETLKHCQVTQKKRL